MPKYFYFFVVTAGALVVAAGFDGAFVGAFVTGGFTAVGAFTTDGAGLSCFGGKYSGFWVVGFGCVGLGWAGVGL